MLGSGPRTSTPTASTYPPLEGPGRNELAPRVAVVDTGPLFAAANLTDPFHRHAIATLRQQDLRLVIPVLVAAEASYLIGDRIGPMAEARFLSALKEHEIRAPEPEDWAQIGQLVGKYRDFPLGAVDASVVVLANRLRTRLILTYDLRHFSVLRDSTGRPFELLPEI